MQPFLEESSIVRRIWSNTDVVLFIFAGASAEFALNKEVDWLYFTGNLPADPIGRLFSTVQYAQQIIFSDQRNAGVAIDRINAIHHGIESSRGKSIPPAAYQDVLYMLMYYSIISYELLERKLTGQEKNEIIFTFRKVGQKMNLKNTPAAYDEWSTDYEKHLENNLANSVFTKDLFKQYKNHLGWLRYFLLLEIQRLTVPSPVNRLLRLGSPRVVNFLIPFYKWLRKYRVRKILIRMMMPEKFKNQINRLELYSS